MSHPTGLRPACGLLLGRKLSLQGLYKGTYFISIIARGAYDSHPGLSTTGSRLRPKIARQHLSSLARKCVPLCSSRLSQKDHFLW